MALLGKKFTFTNDVNDAFVKLVKINRIPSGTQGTIVDTAFNYIVGEFEKDGNTYQTISLTNPIYQGKWQVNNEENNPVEENVEEEFEVDPNNLLLHGGKKKFRRRGKTVKTVNKYKKSKKTRKVNRTP